MEYSLSPAPISPSGTAKVWPFIANGHDETASFAVVEVTQDGHGATMNTASDRYYYILSGSGSFQINEEVTEITAGKLIMVPKNQAYDFWASEDSVLRLLVVNTPAYNPAAEIKVENLRTR